jgi:HK97 family phage prohead protease
MSVEIQKIERRCLGGKFEYRAAEGDKAPVVEGYAALFDSPTDMGYYQEVVRKGAFTKSLAAGADVRLLLNHNPYGLPLARTISGTLEVKEDSTGLFFRSELDPTDPDVQALTPKLRRKDVTQCSFAFVPLLTNWVFEAGKPDVRELLEVDICDVSIVTYPAYEDTSVVLRSRDLAKSQSVETLRLRLEIEKAR